MDLFTSALAKVDRAHEQTEALEREIATFLAEETYETREHFNPETGRKTATFHTTRKAPVLRWAVIVGEIFHDLRSALDHAVTDLTIDETRHPLDGTEFPIFENETSYSTLRSKGPTKGDPAPGSGLYKIRGVSAQAKATIHWLQPFEVRKRSPASQSVALSTLHALNLVDKHRAIHVIRARADGGGWRIRRDIRMPLTWVLPVGEIEDGAIIAEWTPVPPIEGEMDVEFQFIFEVVFSETSSDLANLNGAGVIAVCKDSVRGVRWIIGRLGGDTTPQP